VPVSVAALETDVLVVGAGPVGASLAIELGSHGVRCLVIERRSAEDSAHPRAKLTNIRTMILLRRWGIADQVRAAAPLPADFPSDIAFVTRMTGWELTRFPNAFTTDLDRSRPFPEPAQQVPQGVVESVLRDHARSLPDVTMMTGVALEEFTEGPDGVVAQARIADSGELIQINARYLAGCDGAGSLVRDQLGIVMEGETLAANVSAVFRAPDLWSRHDKAPAVHYWTVTPDAPAILGPLDGKELWWFHLNELPDDHQLSDEELVSSFSAAVGTTFPCEVTASSPWLAQRRAASRYRSARSFLLGDAAHLHPPMGGYGMNMGIGDAVDLGWKLSAVLRGWGGEELLSSYQAERRPIHLRVIDEAASNFAFNSNRYRDRELEREGPAGDELRRRLGPIIHEEKAREFASIGVQLGYRYEDSPIIVADGTEPTPNEVGRYVPTARPGHLAPHAWLDDQHCLYDVFGPDLTLLVLGADHERARPLIDAAAAAEVPLTVVERSKPELRELYEADLALIRPDQHVAWRGNRIEDPVALLDRVRGIPAGSPLSEPRHNADPRLSHR